MSHCLCSVKSFSLVISTARHNVRNYDWNTTSEPSSFHAPLWPQMQSFTSFISQPNFRIRASKRPRIFAQEQEQGFKVIKYAAFKEFRITYILTLKENSFNNRFSTHRVSLGMVYNQHSCCILTEDVTTREGTRENKKMTLNRQSCPRGANLVLRFSRSGRREPEVAGAPGFILKS